MTDQDDESQTVWIRTSPDPEGTYRPTIDVGDDVAYILTRESATEHVFNVLSAVAEAEYDAAVLRQMNNIVDEPQAAIQVVLDLRKDRPDPISVGPLVFRPGVSTRTGNAFLKVMLNGKALGQWTIQDARDHALRVLEAVLVADLDAAYLRTLQTLIQIDEQTSRSIVGDLFKWRDENQ